MPDNKKDDFEVLFNPVTNFYRTMLERIWFRNILYYIGEQWIVWGEGNTFEYMYGYASGVPTPVSDIIKDHVRSMKALIMNKKFRVGVVPNSMEMKDRDSAKLSTMICDDLYRRNDFEEKDMQELCAMMMVLTGNGFIRTFPNPNSGKYVIDKDGNPVVGKGDIATVARMPFDIYTPDAGIMLRDKTKVGIRTLTSKEWVEDTYKKKLKVSSDSRHLADYQRQLAVLVANVSPWKAAGLEASLQSFSEDDVVIEEIEYRPTMEYPKGRHIARCCGEELFDKKELPVPVGKDGSWEYSITHFQYNYNPGSFWASGGVDPLISPQDTINRIDQAAENNRETLGRPFVLTPSELTLRRLSKRGSRLLAIEYDAQSSRNMKPEIHPGTAMPDQMFTDRQNRLLAAQDAGGNPKNVLRGGTPFAGAAGIALETLRESAELSHTPDVDRYFRRWGGVKRKQLIIAQKLYTETRILRIPGAGNNVLVRSFRGSDIHNNTDVNIEMTSGLASTQSGRTSLLMDTIQYGLWNDQMVRPDLRRQVLTLLELGGVEETTNIHMERAEYENSILVHEENPEGIALVKQESGTKIEDVDGKELTSAANESDPVFRLDNHSIHMEVHDRLIFSREFSSLSRDKQENIIGHRDLHATMLAQQQESQSMLDNFAEADAGRAKGGMNETSMEEIYNGRS